MGNIATRAEQKAEARRRLKKIGVMDDVTNGFDEDVLFYSERQNALFDGILYWVSNKPELVEEIKKAEEKYGIFVYHVQLTHMVHGDAYSMLYVASEKDEWEQERADLERNEPYVYSWCGYDREFGVIGIKASNGGISRTF